MGDRAQVYMKDTGVYLYTHWYGQELPEVVRTALSKKWRWGDPSYLARIIFSEMIKDEVGEETGYGIDEIQHGDVCRIVEIDCKERLVTLIGYDRRVWSFEDYLKEPREWIHEG